VVGALIVALTLIAAACTPPTGPNPRTWRVKAVSVDVTDKEDPDPGDEPYTIQLGFRSKVGVDNTTWIGVESDCPWGLADQDVVGNGESYNMDNGYSDIVFPDAQNLDIGDVLLGLAPLEIFGTMTFLVERDVLPGFNSCEVTALINSALPGILHDSLEALIAESPVPPTEQELVDLIVNNIDSFLEAAVHAIGIQIEGLGNPDDFLGIAIQIHLPTKGAFKDLLDLGFQLAGIDNGELPIEELPDTVKVRVGHLLPSSASFHFQGSSVGAYNYVLHTAVAP
jgi:hypothetical protein